MVAIALPADTPFVNNCVVIGAGQGQDMGDWLALRPRRLVLIEPDPVAATTLRTRVADSDKVQIWQEAVSDDAKNQLYRYSYGALNALCPALPVLFTLFPGLTPAEPVAVPVMTPVEMMRRLSLSHDTAHVLVIDAPGAAMAILQALADSKSLHRFLTIRLRGAAVPLYEGETAFDDIVTWLADRGFTAVRQIDRSDPDRPVLTASFDLVHDLRAQLAAAHAALEPYEGQDARHTANKLAQAEQDLARVTDDLDALQAQYQSLHADHQALVRAVKAHLAKSAK